MNMVVEINWGNFRAKFNGREQKAFEWLCSLLFYKEHRHPKGTLRFRNQAGIEATPIRVGEDVIGWQSKFIESRLSEHKSELTRAIDNAKKENPELTHIFFYLNVDFSPSTKEGVTDPSYKTEIEEYAKVKGVSITWRTAGFFETPFVCEENANIARHFFTLGEKSVIDFINELSRHTDAILNPIHSEIRFSSKTIKIDRSQFLEQLKQKIASSPLVVISGEAGIGKTAVIKDFYNQINGEAPFFVFKGNEFNISNVNQLFKDYGNFTLSDLLQEYQDSKEKYIIIDSAEKLSDLEHPEVFQEFLSTLRNADWKIVFTTRLSYLDDLKNTFIQIYRVPFEPLNIPNLTIEELTNLSKDYGFALPENERLKTLLQNPFYLNEYLQNYPAGDTKISYTDFKDGIWNKQIAKTSFRRDNTHRKREECFLEIARRRATSGNFFVTAEGLDNEILALLESDEILKFGSNAGGYFITHDIYEEWAVDKLIERAYRGFTNYEDFYKHIGSSLAIRRAFRSWLSDKLVMNDRDAMRFIEATIDNDKIERHWKDEVLVAVLLSNHAGAFIDHFEKRLLEQPDKKIEAGESSAVKSFAVRYKFEDGLLYRILFILRIACKEIDQDLLKRLSASQFNSDALRILFTKPKGGGWGSVIGFINKHKEGLGVMFMDFILPLLDDWNRHSKQGETTKAASQIALFYLDQLTKTGELGYSRHDDTKDQILRVILNGSAEVKEELKAIFDEMVSGKGTKNRGHYELAKTSLSSITDSTEIAKNLPNEIMSLASLFWFQQEDDGSHYRNDIEQYFGLSQSHFEYYPASAFQTPIFQLLQTASKETVDFILSFTNRSIEFLTKSRFADEIEEVEVFFDASGASNKQYISHRIWNIYRGTQVAPALLESMHMALERWLLMVAEKAKPEIVEELCLYLIKNSRSASITAVVTSVVLAQPSKLFNVAQVLFRTKEFFFYDLARMQLDMSAKSTYSISHNPDGIFKSERLETCKDEHRRFSLEHLAFKYQVFATNEEGEELAKKRQEVLWKIFDDYYAALPDQSKETENDKTWRLFLARMDRRKMKITTEKKDDKIVLSFDPEIDDDLKGYSEESVAESSDAMKYMPLQLWARNRFEKNEAKYKKYSQYEDDHKLVIAETKQIIDELEKSNSEDQRFSLFYRAVPAYTCSVLTHDYFEKLDSEEKEFCKNIILRYASMPLKKGYGYQIADGVDAAINALPLLLKPFPQNSKEIKETLLFTLFDSYPTGVNQRLSDYSVSAMLENLWKESPEDANSIFLGYLLLQPKFDDLTQLIRKENYEKQIYNFSNTAVLERFRENYKPQLDKFVSNQLKYNDIPNLNELDPATLVTAFLLLPLNTIDNDHKDFVNKISAIISKRLCDHKGSDEKFEFGMQQRFLEKFAYFVLNSKMEDIESYLKPFLHTLGDYRDAADLFSEFIKAEDSVNRYDEFGTVWNLFYPKIVELCKNGKLRYSKNIIHNYLLAWPYWNKNAKEWHSLKEREKAFFKKVAEDIGGHPSVLYSLAKLLNEIGTGFADDGIFWISDILQKNPGLAREELEVNSVYYLENLVRAYILRNRYKVRTTPHIKNEILILLNFLLEKGSVTAYLLREDVL